MYTGICDKEIELLKRCQICMEDLQYLLREEMKI